MTPRNGQTSDEPVRIGGDDLFLWAQVMVEAQNVRTRVATLGRHLIAKYGGDERSIITDDGYILSPEALNRLREGSLGERLEPRPDDPD